MKRWMECLFVLSCFSCLGGYAQGCSDAGFCSVEGFKPEAEDTIPSLKNHVKTGFFYGSADNLITVYGSYLEYNRQWNYKWGTNVKATGIAQTGNGISVFGLSDIFFTTEYTWTKGLKTMVGLKAPLNRANASRNGVPLPMDYQSSLGTWDALIGVGYELEKIQFVVAWQQPFVQNKNDFLASDYPFGSDLRTFQSTRNYKRSGDVMLRVSYPLRLHSRWKLTPSVLPIYHLKNDRFTDENSTEQVIMGSQGLTFNGNIHLDFDVNEKQSVQLNGGMPFIVRTARPDGLTRGFLVNVEYRIKF